MHPLEINNNGETNSNKATIVFIRDNLAGMQKDYLIVWTIVE